MKSMLFHMSSEGALLTTCSQRRSPPGADMPVEWICRHRAQPSSSHIPPPQWHLGAAAAFAKGRGWRGFPVNSHRLHCCCCSVLRDVGDFDTPAEPFSDFSSGMRFEYSLAVLGYQAAILVLWPELPEEVRILVPRYGRSIPTVGTSNYTTGTVYCK